MPCYYLYFEFLWPWEFTIILNPVIWDFLGSQALEVTVWRDGMEYQQKYSRGKPVTSLMHRVLPTESTDLQGTHIRFWPDKEGVSRQSRLHIYVMVMFMLHSQYFE